MESRVEFITPEKAKCYLQRNQKNRIITPGVVSQYAKDMADGRWSLTHHGIAFSKEGRLLDGQHRLEAIIKSGKTIRMMVTFGMEDESQADIDAGKTRTPSDRLSILRGEKISAHVVSTVKAAVELSNGISGVSTHRLTTKQIDEALNVFDPAIDFIQKNLSCNDRGIRSAVVHGQIALAWFYVDDLERLREFCMILGGKRISERPGDKAAHLLREFLLRVKFGHCNKDRFEAAKKTQSAITSFVNQRSVGKIVGIEPVFRWPLVEPVRISSFDLLSV
jgi:hypothetical protein